MTKFRRSVRREHKPLHFRLHPGDKSHGLFLRKPGTPGCSDAIADANSTLLATSPAFATVRSDQSGLPGFPVSARAIYRQDGGLTSCWELLTIQGMREPA